MKAHILLVEDHPAVLNATRLLLTHEQYRVTTATSMPGALERVREYPDLNLLITDYHLPNGDTGRKLISAVRQLRGPNFRAVVITGDVSSAVHAFDGDALVRWLCKPVNATLLLSVLQNFIPVIAVHDSPQAPRH